MDQNTKEVEDIKYIDTLYFDEEGIEYAIWASFKVSDEGRIILKETMVASPGVIMRRKLSYEEVLHAVRTAYEENHKEI